MTITIYMESLLLLVNTLCLFWLL